MSQTLQGQVLSLELQTAQLRDRLAVTNESIRALTERMASARLGIRTHTQQLKHLKKNALVVSVGEYRSLASGIEHFLAQIEDSEARLYNLHEDLRYITDELGSCEESIKKARHEMNSRGKVLEFPR